MVCKVTNMFWVGEFFRDKTTRRAYHFTLTHTDTHVQTHTLSHTHPTKAHTHSLIHSHTHTHTLTHTNIVKMAFWTFESVLFMEVSSIQKCLDMYTFTHTHTHTHTHTLIPCVYKHSFFCAHEMVRNCIHQHMAPSIYFPHHTTLRKYVPVTGGIFHV